MENYEQKYKAALGWMQGLYNGLHGKTKEEAVRFFPELKESEGEKIKELLKHYLEVRRCQTKDNEEYINCNHFLAWLEKQSKKSVSIDIESMVNSYKQRLESQGNGSMKNNPLVNMCLTAFKHGVEEVLQELNLKEFEKPQGKSALEAANEEKVDNANKVEPKFKVKYAGNEYNVLETIEVPGGITYYGIEDEPNHIDYILPENCEIISSYGVKEKGNSYPTKSTIFSQQNPAWSEEDEKNLKRVIWYVENPALNVVKDTMLSEWLKSIKGRVQPQPKQEWSEEDEKIALSIEQVMNCASLLNIVPQKIDKVRTWLKSIKERIE